MEQRIVARQERFGWVGTQQPPRHALNHFDLVASGAGIAEVFQYLGRWFRLKLCAGDVDSSAKLLKLDRIAATQERQIGTCACDDFIQLFREHLQSALPVTGHAFDAGDGVHGDKTTTGGIQFLAPAKHVKNWRGGTFHQPSQVTLDVIIVEAG